MMTPPRSMHCWAIKVTLRWRSTTTTRCSAKPAGDEAPSVAGGTRGSENSTARCDVQWKAELLARRPKKAKLVANPRLREYVQQRLSGQISRPDGTPGSSAGQSGVDPRLTALDKVGQRAS